MTTDKPNCRAQASVKNSSIALLAPYDQRGRVVEPKTRSSPSVHTGLGLLPYTSLVLARKNYTFWPARWRRHNSSSKSCVGWIVRLYSSRGSVHARGT